ncbi:hypothetical protein CDD80_1863 [Ophiocordyceps camponoti-rufipedis]|uniref:Uncharacterized protein n=1 Tax=Ophiocordyceps camponoti-rufipedis TaxID=2004952 RepID=A0A2C5Z9H2_9HYPO|nr:hypothetical protein CDD80_1863 [Ophiocordyceps camponoti-rufipedis]
MAARSLDHEPQAATGSGMATSNRIMTLNKAWAETQKQQARVDSSEEEDDDTSTDSDSSSGDIVHVPQHASDGWAQKEKNAGSKLATSTPTHTSAAVASAVKRPGSAFRGRETPVPVPTPQARASNASGSPADGHDSLNGSSRSQTPAAPAAEPKSSDKPMGKAQQKDQARVNVIKKQVRKEQAMSTERPFVTPGELVARIRNDALRSKQNPDGTYESNRSIIFPTNYQLRSEAPRYICSVRDCQTLLKSVTSLAGHFSAKHCSTTFNDNRDGTISKVGSYKNSKLSPAVVVSRNPLPKDAEPPVSPRTPQQWNLYNVNLSNAKRKLEKEQQLPVARAVKPTPSHAMVTSDIMPPVTTNENPMQTISYIQSILAPGHVVPTRPDVRAMLELPQKRSLPAAFIKFHQDATISGVIYACAVAYIIGDEVKGSKACRLPPSRLSDKCIALPSVLSDDAKRIFSKTLTTCVSCHYRSHVTRQRNTCDWVTDVSVEDAEPDQNGDSETSQNRAVAVAQVTRTKREAPVADEERARKTVKKASRPSAERDSMVDLESWEMAPGRLTDEHSGENIAYSGAFLMKNSPWRVSPDLEMQVLVALPGSRTEWTVETDKIRLCTVANGKVRVKIGDAEFVIGPNGGFHVRPGQTWSVENRTYINATIHCISIRD